MKKVFIVNQEDGARVISANILAKDIQEVLRKQGFNDVKRKDVEQFAEEAVQHACGNAIYNNEYESWLEAYSKSLVQYSKLTPYSFYQKETVVE